VVERRAFIHLGNAAGEARKAVGNQYDAGIAFALAAEHLVKNAEDVGDLANVEKFVGCYPGPLAGNLEELRHHRNWIAHGKRAGVGRQSTFTRIEDVHAALCAIVRAIEGR
jgi:hypothetical protein